MYYKILRYSGVVAVAILWAVVILGMVKSGLKLVDDRPISYLGINPSTAPIFNSILFISAIFFSLFGMFLYRKFKLSKLFLLAFLIGQIAQMTAALYQYGG